MPRRKRVPPEAWSQSTSSPWIRSRGSTSSGVILRGWRVRAQLITALDGAPARLVMSDMAPNITGHAAVDQPRAMSLAGEALEFACQVLGANGHFLVKMFQGEGFEQFLGVARDRFGSVRTIKPRASRPESREMYLLASNHGM